MEPEMSQSTMRRRGLTRGARRANVIASPPVRRAWRRVRRRSGRLPSRADRYLRVRRGGTARVISRISPVSCRSSVSDSWVKSRPRSRSAADAKLRILAEPVSLVSLTDQGETEIALALCEGTSLKVGEQAHILLLSEAADIPDAKRPVPAAAPLWRV